MSIADSTLEKDDFMAIVTGLADDLKFTSPPPTLERCPDQWVGSVRWTGTGFEFLGNGKKWMDICCDLMGPDDYAKIQAKRLVIVLESPHIDEFSDGKPLGPARGKTGENIRDGLNQATAAMQGIQINDEYALILMNAIQFQCSLGQPLSVKKNKGQKKTPWVSPRKVCDTIFRACWKLGRTHFCERLKQCLTDQTFVINACTKGETKGGRGGKWLRELVQEVIDDCVLEGKRLKRNHPARLINWRTGRSW